MQFFQEIKYFKTETKWVASITSSREQSIRFDAKTSFEGIDAVNMPDIGKGCCRWAVVIRFLHRVKVGRVGEILQCGLNSSTIRSLKILPSSASAEASCIITA
jgi:hypothetical protein